MSDTTPEPGFPPKPLSRPPLAVHPVCETDPRIAETPPPEDFGIPGINLDKHGRFKVPKLKADYCLLEQAHTEFFIGLGLDQPKPIDWLWPEYIAVGKLTLIEGESNSGTSFLVADMAARVSGGNPWPGLAPPADPQPADAAQPGHDVHVGDTTDNCPLPTAHYPLTTDNCPQQHVMIVIGGDNMHDTLLPRLLNMGANLYNFTILSKVTIHDPAEMRAGKADTCRRLRLPADLGHLEYQLRQRPGTRLVIVDSLSDFCDTDKQFREALRGLQEIAERCHVAVVATARPKNGRSARSELKPSADRRAESVRCVLNVLVDPNDPSQRYLAPARMNLCREPRWLPFRIGDGRLEWGQPLETAPVYQRSSDTAQEPATLLKEAVECLYDTLKVCDMPAKVALKQVMECGFSKGTVIRARRELGVRSFRQSFGPGGWWCWSLKQDEQAAALENGENGLPNNMRQEAAPSGAPRKKSSEPADEFGGPNFDRMYRAMYIKTLNHNKLVEKAVMDRALAEERAQEVAVLAEALANGKPAKNGKNGKNGKRKPR